MVKQKGLIKTDCGVIGAGLAGCAAALELADAGKKVDLFIKGELVKDCNSYLIAGGLAAVPLLNNKSLLEDSFAKHIKETLSSGKGLNNKKIVEFSIKHFYTDVMDWLIKKGVNFDKSKEGYEYDLNKEGGHSKNRIFHISDSTGKTIMQTLGKLIKKHPNITVHENHIVVDLITRDKADMKNKENRCLGFYAYDIKSNIVKTIACPGVFVATGGLGRVFLYTSNLDVATGDGFAICHRAGLPLANMEFIQFHPSVFYDPSAVHETERKFLLTEALRGAGAILKSEKNAKNDFVLNYHPLGSRATRDIVTRAEDLEMKKKGLSHLWLDCTKLKKDKLKKNFKNSYEFCLKKGIDITKEPIPIVYAAHYSNGGVLVGSNGETKIKGCYVIGETSYTGLHGATRLASNSGPECILFGRIAAKHFLKSKKLQNPGRVLLWKEGKVVDIKDKAVLSYYWEIIRKTMTCLVGISRNQTKLITARKILGQLGNDINDFYWKYKVCKEFLEIRNIIEVAEIILDSALTRKESRASHIREDFPKINNGKFKGLTIIQRGMKPHISKI